MAIVQCPECGGMLSTKAAFCPHCGYVPTAEEISQLDLGTKITPSTSDSETPGTNPLKEALEEAREDDRKANTSEGGPAKDPSSDEPDPTKDELPRPTAPSPVLDDREIQELDELSERYEKLIEPGPLAKLGGKVAGLVPEPVRQNVGDALGNMGNAVSEQELYQKVMETVATGYDALNKQVARFTVSPEAAVDHLNEALEDIRVETLDDFFLLRSYQVAKAANSGYLQHSLAAFVQGGAFGAAGVAGIPGNLVVSTLLYYRAVQCVALSYGFDAKDDPGEQVIASQVLAEAFSPTDPADNRMTGEISKFMAIGTAVGVGQAAKKGWAAMIEKGGPALLIAQIRALANRAAAKALEKAGKGTLENVVARELLEQVGRKLTLKAVNRAVPVVGAGIGAFMDLGQMTKVLEYADVFYHKRFLVEKEQRVEDAAAAATPQNG